MSVQEGCCYTWVVIQLMLGCCCREKDPRDLVIVASGSSHQEAGYTAGSLGTVASAGFMQST